MIRSQLFSFYVYVRVCSFPPQIKYFNNKIICDLVEQQHSGVISLLDEACFLVGTVTDKVCKKRPSLVICVVAMCVFVVFSISVCHCLLAYEVSQTDCWFPLEFVAV